MPFVMAWTAGITQLYTLYQYILSTHPINTPYQHPLLIHPFVIFTNFIYNQQQELLPTFFDWKKLIQCLKMTNY